VTDIIKRMAMATIELTADNFHTEAKVITDAANEIASLRAQRDRLIAALTPSGDTKEAYMGEVQDDVITLVQDEDCELVEFNLRPYVSWTAIKAVMELVRKEGGIDG